MMDCKHAIYLISIYLKAKEFMTIYEESIEKDILKADEMKVKISVYKEVSNYIIKLKKEIQDD